jgi:DNA polymerase IV (DinB-like DNA polymerase)
MPISQAWKLCPDCIYLRPHFDLYVPTSNSIMRILKSHADKFEQGGLTKLISISQVGEGFRRGC